MNPSFPPPTGPPSPSLQYDLPSQYPVNLQLTNLNPQFPLHQVTAHPYMTIPYPFLSPELPSVQEQEMDALEYGNRIHVKNIKKNYKLLIQSDTSCVTVELPERHAIHFYPNLLLGRSPPNGTANNDYHTEEFIVRLRYDFPANLDLEKVQRTLRLELRNEAVTMLVYDSARLVIQKEGPVVSLIIEAHSITLPNQYACKEINGRSDGMKRNVQEFLKKRRNLQVSFTDDVRDYFFSCNVICCASSSFHNALKPYRDEAPKIKELFLFLWKELPNPFFIVEPSTPDAARGGYFERIRRHSQLAARQLAGTAKKPRKNSRGLDRSQDFISPTTDNKRKRPEYASQFNFPQDDNVGYTPDNLMAYFGHSDPYAGSFEIEGGEASDEEYGQPYKRYRTPGDESVESLGPAEEVLPLIQDAFSDQMKKLDPTGAELFQKNFIKIKKTFAETKSVLESSPHPESERLLNDVEGVFSFAMQYSYDCLLQNKNVLKL